MLAAFSMDESYFKECLGEWIGSVSKGRKYEPYLCVLFLTVGLGVLLFFPRFKLTGFFSIAIGLIEITKYLIFKRRWLNERRSSDQFNTEAEFLIERGAVRQTKPDLKRPSSFTLSRVVQSRKGYFLYPDSGSFIYLPHTSISPATSPESLMEELRSGG